MYFVLQIQLTVVAFVFLCRSKALCLRDGRRQSKSGEQLLALLPHEANLLL